MTKNNFPIVPTGSGLSDVMVSSSYSTLGNLFDHQVRHEITALESPCPPTNARNDEVVVYRLVSGNPPIKNDFLPTYIEYPHRHFKPEEFCVAQGVSVFTNENAANNKRARYKNLKAKLTAIGRILKEDGRVLETCSKHHMTWWLETDTPHRNFKLVAQ